MGALAELVKDAEAAKNAGLVKSAGDPTGFLARLEKLRQRATEPTTAPADIARMTASPERGGFGLPAAKQEGQARGLKLMGKIGLGGVALGAILRLLRAGTERARHEKLVEEFNPYAGMPTRDIRVPFSTVKKSEVQKDAAGLTLPILAGGTLAAPSAARAAGMRISDLLRRGGEAARRGGEHLFTSTGSPWDEPWVYPAALAGGIGSTYLGYRALDAILNALKERRTTRELTSAKGEFEEALASQHRQSELAEQAGVKFSAAGATGFMADVLAKAHISGELGEQLEKLAADFAPTEERGPLWQYTRGMGNKAFGLYLAALTALTMAGAAGGYHLVKSREGKRKKFEAARELLRRRRLAEPPRVTVEPAA